MSSNPYNDTTLDTHNDKIFLEENNGLGEVLEHFEYGTLGCFDKVINNKIRLHTSMHRSIS